MGAINYGSCDVVNIGLNVSDLNEYDDFDNNYIECVRYDIQSILDNYMFDEFDVSIEPGYYEGFYINISFNDVYYYDTYLNRLDVIKECTQLKRMLFECIKYGLVVYSPGWCTGYDNEKESKIEVNKAIKKLKAYIKAIPTERQFNKGF